MLHSDFLPATQPFLPDVSRCEDWLRDIPSADARSACVALLDLVEDLELAPPPHESYARILERLHEPLSKAVLACSHRFAGKPLPMGPVERDAFALVCDIWQALARTRERLLRAALKGEHPELNREQSQLAMRHAECLAEAVIAHRLARQRVPGSLWHSLHRAYVLAESHRLLRHQGTAYRGNFRGQTTPHDATTTYTRALLFWAGAPTCRSTTQIWRLLRWCSAWSHKVHVATACWGDGALGLDLAGESAPVWRSDEERVPGMRFLDTQALALSLRKRILRLKRGDSPQQIGLGADISPESAIESLAALLNAWCNPPVARRFPRRSVTGPSAVETIEVGAGIAAATSCVATHRATPSESSQGEYRTSQSVDDTTGAFAVKSGVNIGVERWRIEDQSAEGFRLRRQGPGVRVAPGQLMALRPPGARFFILGEIRWLEEDEVSISASIRAIPGLAHVCALRVTASAKRDLSTFVPALLLTPGGGLAQTLIAAPGWSAEAHVLEMRVEESVKQVRMTRRIARGADYERAAFDYLRATSNPSES